MQLTKTFAPLFNTADRRRGAEYQHEGAVTSLWSQNGLYEATVADLAELSNQARTVLVASLG